MVLQIRPLQVPDIQKAVELHLEAFPGFFLSFLGPSFLKVLYFFYIIDHTGVALAGKINGEIVSTAIGTVQPEDFYRRLAKRHFVPFAWASIKPLLYRPNIFGRLLRALFYRGSGPLPSANGALLASICVSPQLHNKGIGGIILKAFEAEMWKRQMEFIYLLTDRDGNQTVRHFYEKYHWKLESEFPSSEDRMMSRYWKFNPGQKESTTQC